VGALDALNTCSGALAELHLGESACFFPSDAALAGWRAQADQGKAVIAYD
jgi:DNA polymerase-3 subunit alpha